MRVVSLLILLFAPIYVYSNTGIGGSDYALDSVLTGTLEGEVLGIRNLTDFSSSGTRIAVVSGGSSSNEIGNIRIYDITESGFELYGDSILFAQATWLENTYSWSVSTHNATISLSGDGNRMAFSISDTHSGGGVVAVYDITDPPTSDEAPLAAFYATDMPINITDYGESLGAGSCIDLNDDGSILAIGIAASPNASISYGNLSGGRGLENGYVQLYKNEGNAWTSFGSPIVNSSSDYEQFGDFLSLSKSGETIAIHSPLYDNNDISSSNYGFGKVSVYDFIGNDWTKRGSDIIGTYDYTRFGESLDFSEDGNTLAIGYRGAGSTNATPPAGYGSYSYPIQVYEYSTGSSDWIQKGGNIYSYGTVDLDDTGNLLLAGDGVNNGPAKPKLYEFVNGSWTLKNEFSSPDSVNQSYGLNALMDSTGNNVVICQPYYKPSSPNYRNGRLVAYSINRIPVISINDLYESNIDQVVTIDATPIEGYPRNFTYQWYFNTFPVPVQFGGAASSFSIDGSSANNGTWSVRVTNDIGNVTKEFDYRLIVDDDGDGIHNLDETDTGIYISPKDTGTDPNNPDSDGDGLTDGQEIALYITDPNKFDTDNDGLSDKVEVVDLLSDPNSSDTDEDGFSDYLEAYLSNFNINSNSSNLSLEEVGLYTVQNIIDARIGSTMIEVSDGKADITLSLEETSDLNDWSSPTTSEKTIQADAPSGTRFYRFKMTE